MSQAQIESKSQATGFTGALKRIFRNRESGVLVALIVLCILMNFASPYFATKENIFNVLRSMSTIGIMAIGMTMVIVTGGIDLSIGSLAAVSAMVCARMITYAGWSPWLAFLTGILVGLGLGAVNGLVVTRLKVTPFIATLGMLSIARGLTYAVSWGLQGAVASNIPMRNEQVNFLGAGYIGPVPFQVIEMVILVVIFTLFLNRMVLGRQIYALGSNEQAARLSGVRVNSVRMFVFAITGAFAALAGIMNAGLLSTAATNLGTGVELDVIAAVVIGGASLSGGEGTIFGAVIGAAIMAVIRNAFVLVKIGGSPLPIFTQNIAIGVVIIAAVALDQLRKRST
jgi:ribose transport system permease protein